MATLACYIAGLCDHGDALVPGERGIVLFCIAPNQKQAKIFFRLCRGDLSSTPRSCRQLLANRTADALELSNVIISVQGAPRVAFVACVAPLTSP